MSLPLLIAGLGAVFLGFLAIYYSLRIERLKQQMEKLESERDDYRKECRDFLKYTSRGVNKMHAELQAEKGKLASLVSSITDGLFMVDAHNKLKLINPMAKHFLNLHKINLETMDVLSAMPIHFDFNAKIKTAIHHGKTNQIQNVPIGKGIFTITISPVHGKANDHHGIAGACILLHDETLTTSVPRMKEDFTNIIIHELRSPLTSIKASSELLISPTKFSKEEQSKLLHLIHQQSEKLLEDVQQILDAAKLEAGVFIIHKRLGNLKNLITEITETFEPEAKRKLIKLVIEVEPNLPAFTFDAASLTHAIANVLSNSMKFTSTGGTIALTARQKGQTVVISIADTGAGIPKDKQQQLFHKFSQISDASANVGTGLGLYLVKGIMEAHGGSVAIDSDQGRGTTIILTLPLTEATHHPQPVHAKPETSQRVVN